MAAPLWQIEQEAERLRGQLAEVQAGLMAERAALDAAVKHGQGGQAHAANVIVLEARERNLQAAISANEDARAETVRQIEGKEYRAGKKQIADAERRAEKAAEEVRKMLGAVHAVVADGLAAVGEYRELCSRYALDAPQYTNGAGTILDWRPAVYLIAVHNAIDAQKELEERRAHLERMTAEIIKGNRRGAQPAASDPEPRGRWRHRQTHADGTPLLDTEPIEYYKPAG